MTPPGPAEAHNALVTRLQDWHRAAGRPSTRAIGAASGCSHTTVHDMLTGVHLPAWNRLSAVVAFLGGDVDEAKKLWLDAAPPAGPLRGSWVPDSEAEAIRVIASVLVPVSPAGRQRILAYMVHRFGVELA
jgi:hypothetical protein